MYCRITLYAFSRCGAIAASSAEFTQACAADRLCHSETTRFLGGSPTKATIFPPIDEMTAGRPPAALRASRIFAV